MTTYRMLSDSDRIAMLEQRLRIYEEQHFDATQNLRMARATQGRATLIDELETKLAELETCCAIIALDLDAGEV